MRGDGGEEAVPASAGGVSAEVDDEPWKAVRRVREVEVVVVAMVGGAM